jgi:hypothetical protein
MFEVSSKEDHGHKRRGHDFGISHFLLAVFRMVERFQEVGTQETLSIFVIRDSATVGTLGESYASHNTFP